MGGVFCFVCLVCFVVICFCFLNLILKVYVSTLYIGTVSSFYLIKQRLGCVLSPRRQDWMACSLFSLSWSLWKGHRDVWAQSGPQLVGEFKMLGWQTCTHCIDSINPSCFQKVTFRSVWSDCLFSEHWETGICIYEQRYILMLFGLWGSLI